MNCHDDRTFIENEMHSYGIDLERFKEENLLHLYQMGAPNNDTISWVEDVKKFITGIASISELPIRGVGLIVFQINMKNGLTSQLQSEYYFHNTFGNINGSWLCPYYIDNIEKCMNEKWIENLLGNHHAVIFAPKLSNGIALNLV
jgi:hypothetical protein